LINDTLIAEEDDPSETVYIESVSFDDFIGVWDTTYDCERIIDYWHLASSLGMVQERKSFGIDKEDAQYRDGTLGGAGGGNYDPLSRLDTGTAIMPWLYEKQRKAGFPLDRTLMYQYLSSLNGIINGCLQEYVEKFEGLVAYQLHVDAPNVQRTTPTEGYHNWHCEDAASGVGKRLLAYMLYLNDGFEGGETEWLYQSRRECPVAGRMVIWPAGWTHMHRGNPPLSGEKYIATGWVQAIRG